jgi:hypothetical protein
VVDFQTAAPVTGPVTLTITGLLPAPASTVTGANFELRGIPENSAFSILASVPPSHVPTYSPVVTVTTSNLTDVKSFAVDLPYVNSLATGFGVAPTAGNGIVIAQLRDGSGPKAGIAASNIVLSGASAPHFLDANMMPSTATSSSSSGWVVFFEVPPGVVSLGQAVNATVALDMPSAVVGAGAVTVTTITVGGAPQPLPTNVSFSQTVTQIFQTRGCVNCHSGNGPGKDLGNLTLDGGANHIYMELTGTENPLRVQTANPEKSLVLTMPSAESPPDGHPNITFTSPTDPDYLKLLVWIREGAKQN